MRGPAGRIGIYPYLTFKDFRVRERFTEEFGCEELNPLNTPLFANPNTL